MLKWYFPSCTAVPMVMIRLLLRIVRLVCLSMYVCLPSVSNYGSSEHPKWIELVFGVNVITAETVSMLY